MKRFGNLIEGIADLDNLKLAYVKACRAKPMTQDRMEFGQSLENRLLDLRSDFLFCSYSPGQYKFFTIRDPKERLISAAPFRDRVAQHALMNVLDPIFERTQIFHSYACRRGKGTQAALLTAFHHTKSQAWFLKLDVRKYFDSIDHLILKAMLGALMKDPLVLEALGAIIDSYRKTPGRGLPIGNLTSQYFANHYLAGLEHFILETLRIPRYIRYMDDMLLLHDEKNALSDAYAAIRDYATKLLNLELKPKIMNRSAVGAPFCGFLLKPYGIFLMDKTKKRFSLKQAELSYLFSRGDINEREYADRTLACASHLRIARSRRFRYSVFRRCLFGLEPRETGRELEQLGEQRSFGESE